MMTKRSKWLALLLCVAVVATSLPQLVFPVARAATTPTLQEPVLTVGTLDLDGDPATADSVYVLTNAAELEWFANHVNTGHGSACAVLWNDIDLAGYEHTPIGVNYSDFAGIFDGRGYTIRNMKITCKQNGYDGHPTYDYQGLFGVMVEAVVRNVTVEGDITLTVDGQNYIGGVVGLAYRNSRIENVNSYVNIGDNGTAYSQITRIGGVVGQLGNTRGSTAATAENCNYYGTIHVDTASAVGGVVGQGIENSLVSNCENYGTVGWNYIAHAAGVVGSAQNGTQVKDCANYGSVRIRRNDCVGGVVGYANDRVLIQNCVNAGTVTAQKSTEPNEPNVYLGGILGYVNSGSFAGLSECFNYGTVTDGDDNYTYTGAIVGYINSATALGGIKDNAYYAPSCRNKVGTNKATGTLADTATASVVTSSNSNVIWENNNWYVAPAGVITMNEYVYAKSNVKLFLADGAQLTCTGGIRMQNGSRKLTIYAQSEPVCNPDGTLDTEKTTTGRLVSTGTTSAGIGSDVKSKDANGIVGTTVVIHGGVITATGPTDCAGIGSGKYGSNATVTITGGFVTAKGGEYATGIGGGCGNDSTVAGNGGAITITGGVVNATGGNSAAGIGGGCGGATGTVTITGGTVTATGGKADRSGFGAGIGSGYESVANNDSLNNAVRITGGTVTANGGEGSAGIGGGYANEDGTVVTISGGRVTAGAGAATNNYERADAIGRGQSDTSGDLTAVTVAGSADVTAIGSAYYDELRSAFAGDLSLTLATGTAWQVLSGDSVATLKGMSHTEAAAELTTAHALRIVPCVQHAAAPWAVTYHDENTHTGSCRWCGGALELPHVPNTQGNCFCRHLWDGTYWDYDEGTFVQKNCTDATVLTAADTTWTTGWYVVTDVLTVTERVQVSGEVHLILADGSYFNSNNTIVVPNDSSLTVYSQSLPVLDETGAVQWNQTYTGELTTYSASYLAALGGYSGSALGGPLTFNGGVIQAVNEHNYSAAGIQGSVLTFNGAVVTAKSKAGNGIGSGAYSAPVSVTINGGAVTAVGGGFNSGIGPYREVNGSTITITGGFVTAMAQGYGAAIGSGDNSSNNTVRITGGTVTATASSGGAGIGGGYKSDGGTIIISGGNVTATGGIRGAGIGGGSERAGGDITITGGTITAKSAGRGAGIGGGSDGAGGTITITGGDITATGVERSAGIGGGLGGAGGTITITGGDVTATGGNDAAGIGSGSSGSSTSPSGDGGVITISGGTVKATAGENAAGIGGALYSNSGIITINDGTVTAIGGIQAAGIGTGRRSEVTDKPGSITINGGTVTALSKADGAGIGTGALHKGTFGDIVINGGTVTAGGGEYGVGIGVGYSSQGTVGDIIINGGSVEATSGALGAAIGYGYSFSGIGGTIAIKAGTVTAIGNVEDQECVGIGVGRNFSGSIGGVQISGGRVTATGGTVAERYGQSGVGIGCGTDTEEGSSFGGVQISGGTVTATGATDSVGIGMGYGAKISFGGITISGGLVTANGGKNAAGMGASISCKAPGDLGGITVSGGLVTANGGENGAGIGVGNNSEAAVLGTVSVEDGILTAVGGANAYAFMAAPVLSPAKTWEVSAGNTVNTLASVASPVDSTYTAQTAVRVRSSTASSEVLSVDITWLSMEFTYVAGDWDPQTHGYADGVWQAAQNGGIIAVQNNGSVAVNATFTYASSMSAMSGSFSKPSMTLRDGQRDTTTLSLSGEPDATTLSNEPLGTVTVTIEKRDTKR